jgi:ribosomal protein S18 acetylase RimI-like enzyme
MVPTLNLQKLTQAEFDALQPRLFDHFVDEIMKARGIDLLTARQQAEQSFESLLPGGRVDTPQQFLFKLVAEGKNVGHLFFTLRPQGRPPEAFLWEIEIDDAARGRGYGKQAMRLLEGAARGAGARVIRLNVFGHNAAARGLYASLGYEPSSLALFKEL